MNFNVRLLTKLTDVFNRKYVSDSEFNFKKTQEFVDIMNEYKTDHKNKETKAHVSSQIAHKDIEIGETTLDKMVSYQMQRIRGLVLGVDGDGVKEVTDSRVSIDSTRHKLLSERLLYDFNKVNSELERIENKFVDINFDEYHPDKTGTTSVSEKLQDAMDRIKKAKGGRIFIPAGDYLLNKRVDVYENTTVELDENATILRGNTNELFMNGPYTDKFYGYNGRGNIHFKGGTLDGNYEQIDKYPTKAANMVNLKHAENITFTNVTFRNNISYHALDVNGVKNLRVTNCVFEGYINLTTESMKEAIQLSEYTRDSIYGEGYYDGTPCRDVIVTGCTFRKSNILGAYLVGVGNHLSVNNIWQTNIVITNNSFQDIQSVCVRPYKWKNVRIENNTFERCPQGVRVSAVGYQDVSAQNPDGTPSGQPQAGSMYFINNNYFNDYTEFGVAIYGNQSGGKTALTSNININGNIFDCNNDDKGEAINLRLCSNIHIKDNTINKGSRGIRHLGCHTLFMDKNYINDVKNESIFNEKSEFLGYQEFARHIHITNNLIQTTGRNGIFLQYAKNFFIRNNTVTNTNQESNPENPRGGIYIADSDTGAIEGNHMWGGEKDFAIRSVRTDNVNYFNNGGTGEVSVANADNAKIGYWNVNNENRIVKTNTKGLV